MYYIRDENGRQTGEVSDAMAGRLMDGNDGHWEQKNFIKSGKVNVYVFDNDFTFGNSHVKVAIWKGSYLIKSTN